MASTVSKPFFSSLPLSSLTTTHSARNLGFIFDEHLTFSDQISSVSKFCYYHIRQLRCIRPYLDTKTASTNATSTVHSKLDNCNSLYHNLPKSHITRLQQIQSSQSQSHHSHPPVSTLAKERMIECIPPSVPSTHHFHHPSSLYSSTPGLKLSFSANPSLRSLPFLLPD